MPRSSGVINAKDITRGTTGDALGAHNIPGGISNPSAGIIPSSSIRSTLLKTLNRLDPPYPSTIRFYIDPTNGVDDTADGTAANPFKTWRKFYESGLLPMAMRCNVYVKVLPGTLDWIYLSGVRVDQPGMLQIYADMKPAVLLTGANTGTATSGTVRSFTKAGAGWTPGDLKGKAWKITAGTHMYYSGRIMDNTADTVTVSGFMSSPFDATDKFLIEESTVTVSTTLYNHPRPLTLYNCYGNIFIWGFDFVMPVKAYANYTGQLQYCRGGLFIYNCSFRATHKAGDFNRMPLWIKACDGIDFYSCSVLTDDNVVGAYSGMYLYGPNGYLGFSDCVFNGTFQCYYGVQYLQFSHCTRKMRANELEFDVFRTASYVQILNSIIDMNLVQPGCRLDGPQCWDCRYAYFENANGDGIWTYGYYGDAPNLSFIGGQFNGNTASGLNIGAGTVSLVGVGTDPAKKNGTWGMKLRNGARAMYGGVNTLLGNTGATNLGDGITNVANNTPAVDAANQTKVAAMGA